MSPPCSVYICRNARIKHFRDTGMIHKGEGLTLRLEPRYNGARIHPQLDNLQGDPSAERHRLLCGVHNSHTALTDDIQYIICIDAFRMTLNIAPVICEDGCPIVHTLRSVVGLQQSSKPMLQPRVARVPRFNEREPLVCAVSEHLSEELILVFDASHTSATMLRRRALQHVQKAMPAQTSIVA